MPHWQGRVSPLLDVSSHLLLIDIEAGVELRRKKVGLARQNPFLRAREIADHGAEVVLCGAISHVLETALMGADIRVVSFLCGDIETVVAAFVNGRLRESQIRMPGADP